MRCLEPVAIIAASLSFKDPFVCPLHKQVLRTSQLLLLLLCWFMHVQQAADAAKRRFALSSMSDHVAVCVKPRAQHPHVFKALFVTFCHSYNAVKGWQAALRAGAGERFVRDNFLSHATLQMLQVRTCAGPLSQQCFAAN